MGQVDAVTSLLVRLFNAAYYGQALVAYDFDLADNSLVYRQVLPLEWESLAEGPKILRLFNHGQDEDRAEFDFVDFQLHLLDAINTLDEAIVTRSSLPPFSAHALITRNGMVRSFDGKVFEADASPGCKYVLTSDFLHGRFAVLASFDDHGHLKTLTVESEHRIVEVEVKTLKVLVDGQATGLPLDLGSLMLRRVGAKVVAEREGLKVRCSGVHGVCSVTLSGWYFGKTGGLFGVYDNEASNDWMTPERAVAKKAREFVDSWRLENGDPPG